MNYRQFYSELGKLLYAVAKADGKVGAKEFDTLKQIVREELVPLENSTDQFGTDNAFYTEMEFEFLEENFSDSSAAFDSFLSFVDTHKSVFTTDLKELIQNITSRIANSELGIHKKEQLYLDALNEKIAEIE